MLSDSCVAVFTKISVRSILESCISTAVN